MFTGLVDLVFFLLVAITVVGSIWLSRKFKERHAEFPWWKAAMLIIVEVVAWVITHKAVGFIQRRWWLVPIVVIIVIVILMRKKKKEEQIL